MPFVRVQPDDAELLARAAEILNAARAHDDPDGPTMVPALLAAELRYGWDLEPDEMYLYSASPTDQPVGVLELALPRRDNLHLVWAAITVCPGQRGQGHGSAILREVLRRAAEAGRGTIWVGAAEDEARARALLERFGFRYASHDARRLQKLVDLDWATLGRLFASAQRAAADYALEWGIPPTSDEVLAELVEVTAAINDAPMGDLTFEDEQFDLQRLRDFETAVTGRGIVPYRVWARHRATGEIGGHTVVTVNQSQPARGLQADTAVRRSHRGHRLGLLLKIEMLRLLAREEPQLELISTFNHADNHFMIKVNEAIGYRLSRVFATYELTLADAPPARLNPPGPRSAV